MSYPEHGYQCPKCGMRFHLVQRFPSDGEITRCATPQCAIRFWHGGSEARGTLRCEVLQVDLEDDVKKALPI